jgi:hypothetical protein
MKSCGVSRRTVVIVKMRPGRPRAGSIEVIAPSFLIWWKIAKRMQICEFAGSESVGPKI